MLGVTTIFETHDQREALSMSDKIVVMKDGRKLQEGPPEEVYNSPVNHFVADFLGHSNFIQGVVVGPKDEWICIRLTDGSEVLAESPAKWQPGEKVELVVRAQKFTIDVKEDFPAPPNTNQFSGEIKERSYMGGEVRYFVELANNTRLHVISMARSQAFKIGQHVILRVSARHCRLLKQEAI
jgi:putative spermidine/putrescine transport system ATP-binding protein/spermidine/putrescine transport system ATP-binding protein